MKKTKIRLHLGCGTIYLDKFINIDNKSDKIRGIDDNNTYNINDNKTTLNNYYKHSLKYAMKTSKEKEIIVDIEDDICNLNLIKKFGIKENSVDEIVCVQALEHIEEDEILSVLKVWHSMLNKKGSMLLSVLDTVGVVEEVYMDSIIDRNNLDWCFRLLYGSKMNKHVSWFDMIKLRKLLHKAGFKHVANSKEIKHDYPALVVRCYK